MENLDRFLSGDHTVTLDEAGRIAIPRDHRKKLEAGQVVVTRGADPCIWLYPAKSWEERLQDINKNTDPDTVEGRIMRRRSVAHAHWLDIDKQGRILIPPALRDFAGLTDDCLILGMIDRIEIWNKERYAQYECSEEEYQEVSEAYAKKKELMNAGNSSHSGIAGRDSTVPGSTGQE